jgi:hypothetical protein
MPSTTYKGYTVPTTGTEVGTWGDDINAAFTNYVDQNVGGIVSKTVAGSNITLSASESRQAMVRLTGTISAAVQVITACQGFTFVENLTTGSFQITFTNGVSGVIVPQGTRVTIFSDATNGSRIVGQNSGLASGFSQTFFNASAPSGWTKSTSLDNGTIRIVSGSGGGTGGTVNFTAAFQSQPLSGTVGDTTLTEAQIPLHGHPWRRSQSTNDVTDGVGGILVATNNDTNVTYTGVPTDDRNQTIGGTGGGQSHTHTWSGTAINLAVKYADAILCTVN